MTLKLQEKFTHAHESTHRAEEVPRQVLQDAATPGSRPGRRASQTFVLRDLRSLSLLGLVWAGYVWVHVAGAIKLFGRP